MTVQAGTSVNAPEKLVDAAETAIASEIEAVRERPSTDVLINGKKLRSPARDEVHYRFETTNPSLRFAEKCEASLPDETVTIYPVEVGEESMVFSYPKDYGDVIAEVELEWENDFVLKRIQESLTDLLSDSERRERIKRMLNPPVLEKTEEQPVVKDDGMRNEAQHEAIGKALRQPVSFIWGPPGTGKTATLAYIMANYVLLGKSVLFVSNTNRAVDHGMMGVIEAMDTLGISSVPKRITRFGERVLENDRLEKIHFEKQLEESLRSQMQEAADLQQWLDALGNPELTPEQRKHVEKKIERLGGVESVEDQISELTQKERYAYNHLKRFKVVGTTLARVCTSDMLESLNFDAVVVDEASMASIPYMLVMASKAGEHLVVVGDPMQLPPIAITTDIESRNTLEKDIFAAVSGARSPGELFQWHDKNAGYTSFFNIQYRMQSDLAKVISEVFYEGRLISATSGPVSAADQSEQVVELDDSRSGSVSLFDTSALGPQLRQDSKRRGFQPVNDVHVKLLGDIIRQILGELHTGLNEIGIIVPFRASVWQLRRELRGKNRWYDLEIGTIHTFQGREKKVIILDTVMTGEPRNGMVQHYSVRPFDEAKNGLAVPRLLNVAFSRSRERLIVLADMQHIKRVYGRKFLGKLLGRLPVRSS